MASGGNLQNSVSRTVGYAYSPQLVEACNSLPRIHGRALLCADLIRAYGLHEHLRIIEPKGLTMSALSSFHSEDYLENFYNLCAEDDPEKIDKEVMEEYGLGYDCPVEEGMFDNCSLIAGASVMAAESLINNQVEVAINWCGGWHHAKRFEAAGFCYINDVVLAIQKLREKFERVLYVDLDLHHGDGVEDAFYTTNKVYTLSIHKYSPGFYPGSGKMQDVGDGKGLYYSLNIPLKDGITTQQYVSLFQSVFQMVCERFEPEAIVCQCGADGLAYDEMDSFNLSSDAYVHCVESVLALNLPTLLLGGGGYNFTNTARVWTLLTACALRLSLPNDIPDDLESIMDYKPDFELHVPSGNRPNENKESSVESLLRVVKGCVNMISKTTLLSSNT
ncbi:HDAC8 [Bugula neritina]|uniref:Histone deacetylase n=1 Tax=Bugula neritina TaxID=10212 RepID=A0A7J7KMR7_BUGNE|nr:HDAC8 [Bugula neritina]